MPMMDDASKQEDYTCSQLPGMESMFSTLPSVRLALRFWLVVVGVLPSPGAHQRRRSQSATADPAIKTYRISVQDLRVAFGIHLRPSARLKKCRCDCTIHDWLVQIAPDLCDLRSNTDFDAKPHVIVLIFLYTGARSVVCGVQGPMEETQVLLQLASQPRR